MLSRISIVGQKIKCLYTYFVDFRLLFSLRQSNIMIDFAVQCFRHLDITRELGMGLTGLICYSCQTFFFSSCCQENRRRGAEIVSILRHLALLMLDLCQSNLILYPTLSSLSNELDLLVVTETWLTTSTGDQDLLDFCPTGCSAVHNARLNKRGGGVALIYRHSISVEAVHSDFFSPTFEYLVITLRISAICVRLINVYRPPSQIDQMQRITVST